MKDQTCTDLVSYPAITLHHVLLISCAHRSRSTPLSTLASDTTRSMTPTLSTALRASITVERVSSKTSSALT